MCIKAYLEELAGSMSDAVNDFFGEAAWQVMLHAAGGRLVKAEGAMQGDPFPVISIDFNLWTNDVSEEVDLILIVALKLQWHRAGESQLLEAY